MTAEEKYKIEWLEFLKHKHDKLKSEILELSELIKIASGDLTNVSIINNANNQLQTKGNIVISNGRALEIPESYNIKMTNITKAFFTIRALGKHCTTAEIVNYIITNHEPYLKDVRKKFLSSVSSSLSANAKPGEALARRLKTSGEFEYYFA